MRFFNRSNPPPRLSSPCGTREVPEFSLEIDSKGNEKLVRTGFYPIYEIIQSSFEGSCISSIITRWRSGDSSVLNQSSGIYGDFTEIPNNLADCQKVLMKAQNLFNSLPVSEREKYNMNLNTFLNSVMNPVSVEPVMPNISNGSIEPPESVTIDGRTYSIRKEGVTNE